MVCLDALTSRRIMGVDIVNATAREIVDCLDKAVGSGKILPVAFANANLLTMSWKDSELKQQLKQFVVLNDGLGCDLASWIIHGQKFSENLNGTDFLPFYLDHTSHTFRIFVLGGLPEVTEAGTRKLAGKFTRHQFVGSHEGYFQKADETQLVAKIREARADLLLIGLGNPKQEKWLARQFLATGCRLGFAVGAFLDFSSGRIPRAPKLVRTVRAEWLFRLALEPRRLLKRYTVDSVFFILAAFSERMYQGSRRLKA
jgi:alpha-1,3-mannosyltransferase